MAETIRIVRQHEHEGLVTFAEGLDAVRDGYRDRSESEQFVNVPRERLVDRERGVQIVSHVGMSPRLGAGGALLHAHGDSSSDDEPGGPTYTTLVYDLDSAGLRGLLLGPISGREYPSSDRLSFGPALESAVGTDHIARASASRLGILGSGSIARAQLVAFDEIRDWADVRVYSPTEAHREAFAAEMAGVVDTPIRAVDGTAAAIDGADVILCATNADDPVFDGRLLEPGQHVTSIVGGDVKTVEAGFRSRRRREIDDETVRRADVYAANSVETARTDEQGDFHGPIEAGVLDWEDVVSLPEIVGGRHPGRETDDQVTVYKQNAMQSATHMALAGAVWERAEARDRGTEIEL